MSSALFKAVLFVLLLSLISCEGDFTPKPKGYPRVNLPETGSHEQLELNDCPFSFEYPGYANIIRDTVYFDTVPPDPCWFSIHFPSISATLYMSYKPLGTREKLYKVLEDAHTLTFKHTVKASYIDQSVITNTENLYGIYYEVGGNAASAVQFFLTDSARHFVRGSLYFRAIPNADSLAPVLRFVEKDIAHILRTFRWKED